MIKPGLKILIPVILLLSTGCNKNQDETDPKPNSQSSSISTLVKDEIIIEAMVKNYSAMLQKRLDASTLASLSFKESIIKFLAKPDTLSLEKAKQQWLESYLLFNQTAPFRILQRKSIPGTIDSWPIMPGYIDSIPGFPNSGIVNDITLTLDEKNLRNQHGLTSPDEVSIGFHAIEFLLWGNPTTQNTNSNAEKTKASKNPEPETHNQQNVNRFLPVTHWEQAELDVSQHGNNRRRKYLSLSTTLLLNDIENTNKNVKDIWLLHPEANTVFHALTMQIGKIRKQLSDFNESPYTPDSFSGAIHNDLALQTLSIVELLKPLTSHEQSNTDKAIQNLSLIIIKTEKTLEELKDAPEENSLWDRLDFNLSQLESLLFSDNKDSN